MKTKDLTLSFRVDQTPEQVFDAINNITGWWIDKIDGGSEKLNDEYSVNFFDGLHVSTQKVTEFIPGKRVVWLVTKSRLDFLQQKDEWTGTKIIFDISREGDKTKIDFTHEGLVPTSECFGACQPAWTEYIMDSLQGLITTGKGAPTKC